MARRRVALASCLAALLLHSVAVAAIVSKKAKIRLPHPHPPDELTVHYLEAGEASAEWPTVLLLHGARFTAADFGEVGILDTIAELGAHAVAPDLPSYGSTPGPKLQTEALKVAWLISFMDSRYLQRVVVLACSMSGMWALPLTLHAPDRVAGLVPVGAVGIAEYGRAIKERQDQLIMPVLTLWGENDHPQGTTAKLWGWVFPHQELHVLPLTGHACWYEDRVGFKDTFRAWFLEHQEAFKEVAPVQSESINSRARARVLGEYASELAGGISGEF